MFDVTALPPIGYETRAERADPKRNAFDKIVGRVVGAAAAPLRSRALFHGWRDVQQRIATLDAPLRQTDDDALRRRALELRAGLRKEGLQPALVAEGFALVRETAGRRLGLRHYDCQLLGGWALLRGSVVEMETGEGKTLTATLPASLAALAGVPVHVITVNDYLTARDVEWMRPVYESLGLTTAAVTHAVPPTARRDAYRADIVYATNKELVFDYLRDRMRLGDRTESVRLHAEALTGGGRTDGLLLRGLYFAIVDEADSILIDEARTPLIISGGDNGEERDFLEQALELAQGLQELEHFTIDRQERQVEIAAAGIDVIAKAAENLGPLWQGERRRQETVRRALEALYLFERDEHYVVRDGKVAIVDEFTGRIMADRAWERGLHQLVELKEGCQITAARETLARISYQRFFRRYLHLSGMTGTAAEVRGELRDVYGLAVTRIPTHRPRVRRALPDRVFATLDAKWQAVAARVRQLHEAGQPVLVGTRSVAASEHLSALLTEHGLPHRVLNAKFDEEEAQIIAAAGHPGRITIATNMAGRGTDIELADGVTEAGGLHVILTERHEAGRIDRQLAGRCGRQGDPGSHEALVSLEDPLLVSGRSGWLGAVARRVPLSTPPGRWLGRVALRRAQLHLQRLHARMRRDLLNADERRGNLLSFSGRPE